MFVGLVWLTNNHMQGSTNLIFACTDFHARRIVSRARLCTQIYVCIKKSLLGANLYRLIYNVLIDIINFIFYKKYQTRISPKGLVALTEYQKVGWRLIKVENWDNKNDKR